MGAGEGEAGDGAVGGSVPVADFLGLRVDPGDPLRYAMPLTDDLLNSAGTLWGGVGLSAFVAAAELAVERRCVWATVQYLAPIRSGGRLQMDIELGGQGIALTQANGRGTVDGQLVLLAIGTFGGDGPHDLQFSEAPDIAPPMQCPLRSMPAPWGGGILRHIEQRTPPGMALPDPLGQPGSGRTMLWMRLRHAGTEGGRDVAHDVGALAVLADLAPSGISEAIGRPTFGTSLDNSIRAARLPDPQASGWVLMDITVEAVVGRVAQISARMYDEGGRLLAVAGQSARLRRLTRQATTERPS
ncbi:MAG TPA: thioesterase family protein [Frankiaceae bacterium]|nr:thioesterase family protein [Frankiaceae bacterium]